MPAPTQQSPNTVQGFHAAHGIAATLVVGVALVFALQYLGFRFVVAAGVGKA